MFASASAAAAAGRWPRCAYGGAKLQQVRDKSKEKPDFFLFPCRQPLHGSAGGRSGWRQGDGASFAGACRAVLFCSAMTRRAGGLSVRVNVFRKRGLFAQCILSQCVTLSVIKACNAARFGVLNGLCCGLKQPVLPGNSVLVSSQSHVCTFFLRLRSVWRATRACHG